MNGFLTATFPDLIMEHLKPRNRSQGNVLRRHWQFGLRDYALGAHPVFEICKCGVRCLESPPFLGAVARLFAYGFAGLTCRRRILPPVLVRQIRQEQLSRLNPITGIIGKRKPREVR